jgi:hypothetical protein
MTITNSKPIRYTKAHKNLTGLNAQEALKRGSGITTKKNITTITNWFWEVFLGDADRIYILINKQELPNKEAKKWKNIT